MKSLIGLKGRALGNALNGRSPQNNKLICFMYGEIYNSLTIKEQKMLSTQVLAMGKYAEILTDRVSFYKKAEVKNEKM